MPMTRLCLPFIRSVVYADDAFVFAFRQVSGVCLQSALPPCSGCCQECWPPCSSHWETTTPVQGWPVLLHRQYMPSTGVTQVDIVVVVVVVVVLMGWWR